MKIINSENFVDEAEKVIQRLDNQKNNRKPSQGLSTSKIRNLLSMTSDIYNEVMLLEGDDLGEEIRSRISYLRVRCIYEAGRDESVRLFVQESHLLDIIPSINDRKEYLLFSRYMESLVAWHRYRHGKDE